MTLFPWLPWLVDPMGAVSVVCPLVMGDATRGYWWATATGRCGLAASASEAWAAVAGEGA